MADDRLRELERAAAAGGEEDQRRYWRELCRRGDHSRCEPDLGFTFGKNVWTLPAHAPLGMEVTLKCDWRLECGAPVVLEFTWRNRMPPGVPALWELRSGPDGTAWNGKLRLHADRGVGRGGVLGGRPWVTLQ